MFKFARYNRRDLLHMYSKFYYDRSIRRGNNNLRYVDFCDRGPKKFHQFLWGDNIFFRKILPPPHLINERSFNAWLVCSKVCTSKATNFLPPRNFSPSPLQRYFMTMKMRTIKGAFAPISNHFRGYMKIKVQYHLKNIGRSLVILCTEHNTNYSQPGRYECWFRTSTEQIKFILYIGDARLNAHRRNPSYMVGSNR